jgi:PEP-CTERM motif
MRKILTGLLAAAAITAIASGPARADDVTLLDGGNWYSFFYGAPGDFPEFQTQGGDDITFNFTLTSASVLYVADGFFDGDQYSLALTNLALPLSLTNPANFTTSEPPGLTANDIEDNFNLAFAPGSTYSHIAINVGPGSYTLEGAAVQSPYGAGQGGIKLGGSVPEPATWAMMLVGFGGLGAMLRRARRASAALA